MDTAELTSILSQDADDVGRWAACLDADRARGVVRNLLDVFKNPEQELIVRLHAAFAIQALPPDGRYKPDHSTYAWPQDTIDYALDTLSEILFHSTGEIYSHCARAVSAVLYQRYIARKNGTS